MKSSTTCNRASTSPTTTNKKKHYAIIHPPSGIVRELSENAFIVPRLPTPDELRQWSISSTGTIYAGQYFVVHAAGPYSETYILDNSSSDRTFDKILHARGITQRLLDTENVGWTFSQMARKITAWLGLSQRVDFDASDFLPRWHYQSATPGKYPFCQMADLTSAYWQVCERAECPVFRIQRDDRGRATSILYQRITKAEQRKWDAIREHVAANKRLRLTLVGTNAAGCWQGPAPDVAVKTGVLRRGKWVTTGSAMQGSLAPLSLLAARCTYELTQLQAEHVGAYYSNADCVICDQDYAMDVWDAVGAKYDIKARGHAIIRGIYAYRVGDTATKPYREITRANPDHWQACAPYNLRNFRLHKIIFTGGYK